jgi:phosphatidylserine decarboxylase
MRRLARAAQASREGPLTGADLHCAPALAWSRLVGRFSRLPLPGPVLRGLISGYATLLDVEMAEAAVPDGGYTTFGEFFARELLPGARRVDVTPGALVAPCDGVVTAAGDLRRGAGDLRFRVKGRDHAVSELLERRGWWDDVDTGGYAVVYLSPADYHRVHSPVEGELRDLWRLPGTCWPVNRVGQTLAPRSIVRNERVAFDLATGEGPIALVMVGALAVREIEVTLPGAERGPRPVRIDRAQEIAAFNLGSTVVMLWHGRARLDVRPGQRVRVGECVARR